MEDDYEEDSDCEYLEETFDEEDEDSE